MDRFGTWIAGFSVALLVYIIGIFFEAPLLRLFSDLGFDRSSLSFGQILFLAIIAAGTLGAGGMYKFMKSEWAQGFVMQQRIHSLNDIEKLLGHPFAGWLPFSDDPIAEMADVKGPLYESLSSMADRIRHDFFEEPPRHFLVTSTRPAEGKSTLSVGLAHVWTRRGHKVLLIDADLRSATLHRYLGVTNKRGLSNILAGASDVEDHVQPTELGFDLITAGPTPPNAAELLSTERYAAIVRHFLDTYEIIIVDTAPVLGLADAPALARQTDVILYTMQHDQLRPRVVLDAVRRLTNLSQPKIILAGTGLQRPSDFGYGYVYGYGSDDDEKGDGAASSGEGASTATVAPLTIGDRWLRRVRTFGVPLVLLGIAAWGAVQFYSYLRPAHLVDMGGGIEAVETRHDLLTVDVAIGEYEGVDTATKEAGTALEAVAIGVRRSLAEVRPDIRVIDVRFYALRRDRLGNFKRVPQFSLRYARSDLAAVNLDEIRDAQLIDIAASVTIIDPRFREEVKTLCMSKERGEGIGQLCSAVEETARLRPSS